MPAGNQTDIVDFLQGPEFGAPGPDNVRVVQTHISIIVLNGGKAWKLKRAVHFPYADFSTPALRLQACEQEVVLNRRTAPTLYLAARRVTREGDGRLALDGSGELVDAVVEMQRFDEDTLFSNLAQHNRLDAPLVTALARSIAAFHAEAEVFRNEGGAENIAAILTLNEQNTAMAAVLGSEPTAALRSALRHRLAQHQNLLNTRARAGKIRRCHGDLHLRNLCLVDNRPTLFDCIEFNAALATTDILYDLAFLLMDLWQAGMAAHANWLMNRYLDEHDETDGLALLPFFMALRASIRAQVLATQAELPDAASREEIVAQAQGYLSLAMQLLESAAPQLIAIGGLSGSGKSTVAAAIAHRIGPAPGARVLASDRIRKHLAGVSAETPLPPESYTAASSEAVYATLYERCRDTLAARWGVIADAVFSRSQERARVAQCADQAGVPFLGFWLEAKADILIPRVNARRGDASDAGAEVVRRQLERDHGPVDWEVIAAGDEADTTARRVLAVALTPPWAEAPEGWNWRAQDEDGRWFWYAVEPQLGAAGGIWRSPRRAQQFAGQGVAHPLWYETCTKRE